MPTHYLSNRLNSHGQPLDSRDQKIFSVEATDRVVQTLALRENNEPTPLHFLPGLAAELGLGALYVKDEGSRLGLGSFKALGGAYAVMVLVKEKAERVLERELAWSDLTSRQVREVASRMTFTCATDGNHGRSVAQGASLVGARSVIFVHQGVSSARVEQIACWGAEIVRFPGSYDGSVLEAARVAAEQGWTVLSDTSWPGYEEIPSLVAQGYTVLVREILQVLTPPTTHIFLQAGVGGFAAAVAGHMSILLGDERPHVTVVEPERAACLYKSAQCGRPSKVDEAEPTVMAMLECYEASPVAFRVLERIADGFMTVDEESAPKAMRRLAFPCLGDPPIVAGESGAAGLAGLLAVLADSQLARTLKLDGNSRVLVVNTEGATDPTVYHSLVGCSPESVLGQAANRPVQR